MGAWVRTAGDVNNDGHSDVIVSAPNLENGQTDEGVVFVYNGSAYGLPVTANWTAVGGLANAHMCYSETAGDVNGDGYGDLITGSLPCSPSEYADIHRASVYYGNTDPGPNTLPNNVRRMTARQSLREAWRSAKARPGWWPWAIPLTGAET